MPYKFVSTRMDVIKRSRGDCSVEKSAYISRSTLRDETTGIKYHPSYDEDLVHAEVMLPSHAPEIFHDREKLWSSVEEVEKNKNAQLARMYKVSLPNEWSHELAVETMRDYIQRNFVDEGMCADFAIHDKQDKITGNLNLHCHIMLTMRPLNEDGTWGDKQKKVYKLDKDGNKIKKRNGRYDCSTVKTTNWDDKDNAKKWRKDLVDTINSVNERIGNTEFTWEYRSFKELGSELKPTIHLGEKVAALERQGIKTDRGNYNRDVREYNAIVEKCKAFIQAEKEAITTSVSKAAKGFKSEVLSFVQSIRQSGSKMRLPIVSSKFIGKTTRRQELINPKVAEDFIIKNQITSFDELESLYLKKSGEYFGKEEAALSKKDDIARIQNLIKSYERYKPYKEIHDESKNLTGIKKFTFDRQHKDDLEKYAAYKSDLLDKLSGEKIAPKVWEKNLAAMTKEVSDFYKSEAKTVDELACMEIIRHTKEDFDREIANESHKRSLTKSHKRNEELS